MVTQGKVIKIHHLTHSDLEQHIRYFTLQAGNSICVISDVARLYIEKTVFSERGQFC